MERALLTQLSKIGSLTLSKHHLKKVLNCKNKKPIAPPPARKVSWDKFSYEVELINTLLSSAKLDPFFCQSIISRKCWIAKRNNHSPPLQESILRYVFLWRGAYQYTAQLRKVFCQSIISRNCWIAKTNNHSPPLPVFKSVYDFKKCIILPFAFLGQMYKYQISFFI